MVRLASRLAELAGGLGALIGQTNVNMIRAELEGLPRSRSGDYVNVARGNCRRLIPGNEMYEFSFLEKQLTGSIENVLRYINIDTGVRTSILDATTVDPVSVIPDGVGLFRIANGALLKRANEDIIRLFSAEINYSSMTPKYDKKFTALFWQYTGERVFQLDRVLGSLRSNRYFSIADIITRIYIPLLRDVLILSDDDIQKSSTEIIHYTENEETGLEQHIDNVTRTGGVMGPVCSISFSSERDFDLLPCLTAGSPMRIHTVPGDVLIIDSDARVLWSHSVPFGENGKNRYSIIIRPLVRWKGAHRKIGCPVKPLSNLFFDTTDVLKHSASGGSAESGGFTMVAKKGKNTPLPVGRGSTLDPEKTAEGEMEGALTPSFDGKSIDTDRIDLNVKRFWKGVNVSCDFESFRGQEVPTSDMPISLFRNEKWRRLNCNTNPLTIAEVYGHDGADTLTFIHSFENCKIHCASTVERLELLKANVAEFREGFNKITYYSDIREFRDSLVSNPISILYIDPPWTKASGGTRPSELTKASRGRRPSELTQAEMTDRIYNDVIMHVSNWDNIQCICLKVRHDWDPEYNIITKPKSLLIGYFYVQKLMITSRNGKAHYYHTISRMQMSPEKHMYPPPP